MPRTVPTARLTKLVRIASMFDACPGMLGVNQDHIYESKNELLITRLVSMFGGEKQHRPLAKGKGIMWQWMLPIEKRYAWLTEAMPYCLINHDSAEVRMRMAIDTKHSVDA